MVTPYVYFNVNGIMCQPLFTNPETLTADYERESYLRKTGSCRSRNYIMVKELGERTVSIEYSITITTFADKESAKKTAKLLVEKCLAACVQIFPIESIYLWEGEICDENEYVLFIKSKTALFDKIMAAIKENHSYEVPEIIQIPVTSGLPEYFNWIDEVVK